MASNRVVVILNGGRTCFGSPMLDPPQAQSIAKVFLLQKKTHQNATVWHRGVARNRKNFATGGTDPYFWSKFSNSWVKKRFLPRQGGMPPTWLRPWTCMICLAGRMFTVLTNNCTNAIFAFANFPDGILLRA